MPPAASLAVSLKKSEGDHLTRHDIQYALLEKIFNDKHAVFTPRPGSKEDLSGNRVTFGDLYIEDVLSSNKLSKTLKDKFLNDMDVTRKVCMASVLVNTGRINTTLVFTPTQARTYNPIPAIQAYGSGQKMLQDAPRLKGILKGCCDAGPTDWPALREAQKSGKSKPNTSPVTLLFLLTHFTTTMDLVHFPKPGFLPHELLIDYDWTSDSRCRAFLWIMYFYLETNGTLEEAKDNPFGAGQGNYMVPELVRSSYEESQAENIDMPAEKAFAARMAEKRSKFIADTKLKSAELLAHSKPSAAATPDMALERANSATPAAEDSVRRSSRKPKRSRTYDSGQESDDQYQEGDDWRALRAKAILRHQLRRSHHRSRQQRKSRSAIQRAFELDAQDDALAWTDEDGEEATTLYNVIERARKRIARRAEQSKRQGWPKSIKLKVSQSPATTT